MTSVNPAYESPKLMELPLWIHEAQEGGSYDQPNKKSNQIPTSLSNFFKPTFNWQSIQFHSKHALN